VGVDVVPVAHVSGSVKRFGDRYLNRLFTRHELDCCDGEAGVSAAALASRFAAKEAAIKVLRPSEHNPDWRSIEVRRHRDGWCELHLVGYAAELAHGAGITDLALSISHDGGLGVAVVVALCGDLPDPCPA